MSVRNDDVFYEIADGKPGEVKLWTSVLLRAFNDALGEGLMGGSATEKQRIVDDARRWLVEGGPNFVFVCENAEQNPEAVREVARRWSSEGWIGRTPRRVSQAA